MLRKFCFTLAFFAAYYSLSAQDKSSMDFGIHYGPGISLFYNQNPETNPRNPYKPTFGSTNFGFSYQYNFPRIVSIRSELNFEQKGDFIYSMTSSSLVENVTTYNYRYAFDRINYVTVPVTCRLGFGKTVRFFTNVGLYAGFRTSANRVLNNINYGPVSSNSMVENKTTIDLTNDIRPVDGGLVTGLGIEIPVWKMLAFTFEARNNFGFADLNNNSPIFQNSFYNNSTSFLFGLSYRIPSSPKSGLTNPKYTGHE